MSLKCAKSSNFDALPDSANIDDKTMAEVFGVAPSTIWRRARAGDLPKPTRFSDRCTRWNVGQVRQVLAQKLSA